MRDFIDHTADGRRIGKLHAAAKLVEAKADERRALYSRTADRTLDLLGLRAAFSAVTTMG